jgi:cytochrome P450
MYAALRDHDPVHHVTAHNPEHDYWVLSRHADIWSAARDHQTFSSAQGLTVNYNELELIGLADNPPMVMQDPPVHTEFRKLVARGFTPRQVEAVEPKVREFVIERVERMRTQGGGDIIAELFKPLPSMVVAHYLGVPDADRAQFDGWTDAIVAAGASGPSGVVGAGDAVLSMMAYFSELIERRRRDPGDDTVSHLVAAGVGADGDTAGVLSILAFTFTMVTGGNDTTTGLLGGAVQLLDQRPDQRALLARQPELMTDAIEEFLRLTSPVQGLARTATRDVTIAERTIPAGRKVLLLYGSLRERSFSRLAVEEAARLLQYFGCETRIFDPSDLPLPEPSVVIRDVQAQKAWLRPGERPHATGSERDQGGARGAERTGGARALHLRSIRRSEGQGEVHTPPPNLAG